VGCTRKRSGGPMCSSSSAAWRPGAPGREAAGVGLAGSGAHARPRWLQARRNPRLPCGRSALAAQHWSPPASLSGVGGTTG
jgi:hypothetical protein